MALFRWIIIGVNIRTQVGLNHRVGMSREAGGGSEGAGGWRSRTRWTLIFVTFGLFVHTTLKRCQWKRDSNHLKDIYVKDTNVLQVHLFHLPTDSTNELNWLQAISLVSGGSRRVSRLRVVWGTRASSYLNLMFLMYLCSFYHHPFPCPSPPSSLNSTSSWPGPMDTCNPRHMGSQSHKPTRDACQSQFYKISENNLKPKTGH